MKIFIHGTHLLHDSYSYEADQVPQRGDELKFNDDRYHVIGVRWHLNDACDGVEHVRLDVAPDADNRGIRDG